MLCILCVGQLRDRWGVGVWLEYKVAKGGFLLIRSGRRRRRCRRRRRRGRVILL